MTAREPAYGGRIDLPCPDCEVTHPWRDHEPIEELARDTGGTSQRRGVHGDPWRDHAPLRDNRPPDGLPRVTYPLEHAAAYSEGWDDALAQLDRWWNRLDRIMVRVGRVVIFLAALWLVALAANEYLR